MKYGIYFAYWEKEWDADQIKYIHKVKQLGFDGLEISCAMLREISCAVDCGLWASAAGESCQPGSSGTEKCNNILHRYP